MSLSDKIFLKISANADELMRVFRHCGQEVEKFNNKTRRTGGSGHFRGLIADLRRVRQESRQAYQQMSALQKEAHRAKQFGSFMAGGMAATYMLQAPVKKTMSFDLRLRHMANTAFAGESLEHRRRGVSQLEMAINNAVRQYGGTREDAANALDSVIASGVMNPEDTMAALPTIQKYATAFNAQSEDMAAIVQAGVQNMRVDPKNIARLFEMAGKGGQEGGYELKDMAKLLADQSTAAADASIRGEEGFAHLIALKEVARTSAGTADSAGRNVSNLLRKLKSRDTLHAFQKEFDIDLTKEYAKGLLEGKDTLDVYLETIDKLVAKDKRFQHAKKMAAEASQKGDKSDETWNKVGDIVQSSLVGKIMRDAQAGAALAALMSQREMMGEVRKKVLEARGIGDDNFALIKESNAFKTSQVANEKEIKTQEAFKPFNNALGVASEKLLEFAESFPKLTTAATSVGYGAAALGVAGVGGSIFSKIAGGAGTGGGLFSKLAGSVGKVFKGTGTLAMKAGKGASSIVYETGKSAGSAVIRQSPRVISRLGSILSARASFGLGTLFHSETLNQGEDARMHALRQSATRQAVNSNPDLNKNRAALGFFGNEISKQIASSISKSGDALVDKTQGVEQALLSKIGATKIEGNINVRITAAPGLEVETRVSGNNNTVLNMGMVGIGGG